MAIERTDLETEGEDSKEEARKAAEAEAQAAEEARQAKEAEREERLRKAELEAATARGEAEALKRGLDKHVQVPEWTPEKWEEEGAKRGMGGKEFKQLMQDASEVAGFHSKQARQEAEEARKEAKEAREELQRMKAGKTLESVEAAFYKKNPALENHRALVEDFINSYPDADRIDAKTLEKRLNFAVDIVKGKVKENMRTRKPGESGSTRLEIDNEERTREPNEIPDEFDPRGTGNEGAAALMSRVHSSFGKDLRYEDSIDAWKKSLDDEGRGVAISMDEDRELARRIASRPLIGGKKGR